VPIVKCKCWLSGAYGCQPLEFEKFFQDHREHMDLSVGALMTLRRAARVTGILILSLMWISCGDTFRPVAVPIPPPPPNPSSFHFVLTISENGPNNPGSSARIDVSGDSNIGEARVGLGPVHATLLPNGSRIYVANNLEDTVSSYAPSNATSVTTVSLPPGSTPVFVNTTESGTVYVANLGNNTNVPPTLPTVAAISTVTNVVTNNIVLAFSPITLAETPDGKKVYAVGGGNGAVSINTIDKSVNPLITHSSLVSPVWVATRSDSQRAYVLNQGSGTVTVINTFSDAVLGSVLVGAGANFMLYDPKLTRLYVTNPAAGTVSILDASADPPNVLARISLTAAPNNQCTTGMCPVSVTALADGSRAYVASYQVSAASCPANQPCSITSQVTVINASSNTISSVIPLGTVSVDTANDTGCNPATSTHPTRFRLAAASSADSSRVYVTNCDAGNTAIIRTSDDTQVGDVPAPLSDFPPVMTKVNITAATQSGSNTTYTYSLTSGPDLQVGMSIVIARMTDPGNNGTFAIAALGAGTFTVGNGSGVTASGQTGMGTVAMPPPQNPVFILAGP
jgi:YVTN family beta-propeller protein